MNTNKIATGSVNKKLLAALAVLAVALAAIAAVPVFVDDSDAVSYTNGIVAAGLTRTSDSSGDEADAILSALTERTITDCDKQTGYALFYYSVTENTTVTIALTKLDTSGSATSTVIKDSTVVGPNATGLHYLYFDASNFGYTADRDTTGNESAALLAGNSEAFDPSSSYSMQLSVGTTNIGSAVKLTAGTNTVYQDLTLGSSLKLTAETITIAAGKSLSGTITDGTNTVVLDALASASTSGATPVTIKKGDSGLEIAGSIASGTLTATDGDVKVSGSVGAAATLKSNYLYTDATSKQLKEVILNLGDSSTPISLTAGAQIVLKADQIQSTVLKAVGTSGTTLSYTTANDSQTLDLKTGGLEIVSGAYKVEKSDVLTTAASTGLTVDSGAYLEIDNSDVASSTKVDGTVTLNGIGSLGLTVVPEVTGTGTRATASYDSSALDPGFNTAVDAKAVQAYTLTPVDSISHVSKLWADAVAVVGETVYVVPDLTNDDADKYVVTQVGYGLAVNDTFTYSGTADRDADPYPSWSFKVVANDTEDHSWKLNAIVDGGYTATFIAVNSITKQVFGQYVSVPYDGTTITIPVTTISNDSYVIGGYYKDAELNNQYAAGSASQIQNVTGSVNIYVKMIPQNSVTYVADVAAGGSVVGAVQAQRDSTVYVTVTANDGYEFVPGAVKAVYAVDGDEVEIVVTPTNEARAAVDEDAATADGGYYSFKMPGYPVTFTATFKEKFDVSADKYVSPYTEKDGSSGTITVTGISDVDDFTQVSNVSKAIGAADNAVQSIEGRTVTFTIGSITAPENAIYGVADVQIQDVAGNRLSVQLERIGFNSDGGFVYTYTFVMPGQDVKIVATYNQVETLSLAVGNDSNYQNGSTTATYSGVTLTADSSDSYAANDPAVAVGTTVTVKTVPTAYVAGIQPNHYALSDIEIVDADGSAVIFTQDADGNYVFTMPASNVTVTTLYDTAYLIKDVLVVGDQANGGVDSKNVRGGWFAAGAKVQFNVTVADGSMLKSIVADLGTTAIEGKYTPATTGTNAVPAYVQIGNNYYELTWNGSSKNTAATSTSAPTSTSGVTSIFKYDKETSTVTMLMPAATVNSVTFTFDDQTYVTVKVQVGGADVDLFDDGAQAKLYSDAAHTKALTDADAATDGFQVLTGESVYIYVVADNQNTITGQSVSVYTPAVGTAKASTVLGALSVVSAPSSDNNNGSEGVYGFTAGDTAGMVYTAYFTIRESPLQTAKNAASDYVKGVQASTSMSETIANSTGTWSEAEDAIFTKALNAIDAASTIAAVNAAQNTFDDEILPAVKTLAKSNLDVAYQATAYALSLDAYNAANTAIDVVVDDNDDSIQVELDAVIAAYDAAMAQKPTPTPTPEPGDYATSIRTNLTPDGKQIMLMSGENGKLIQAGTVSITVTYYYTEYDAVFGGIVQGHDVLEFTYPISADTSSALIDIDYSGIDSARTVVGAVATLTVGSLTGTTSLLGFSLA